MKKNMGNTDRLIRLVIAAVVVVLYFTGQITGTAAIVLLALSVVFILTSFIGFCPLYFPFRINTSDKKTNKQ